MGFFVVVFFCLLTFPALFFFLCRMQFNCPVKEDNSNELLIVRGIS